MFGVIFDVDGVLVDSALAHWESWRRLAAEFGRELTHDAFMQTFGRQNRDIIPLFFGRDNDQSIRCLGDRKEVLYRQLIRDRVPPVDGAVDLVRACRQAGFRLAVGSSAPAENATLVLEGLGIADCFDAQITAEQVTRGKPDPQVFQLAAAALRLPVSRCAVIEDAPAGIEAALRAGTVAIGLAGGHPPGALAVADRVVASLRELTPAAIEDLIRSRRAGTKRP